MREKKLPSIVDTTFFLHALPKTKTVLSTCRWMWGKSWILDPCRWHWTLLSWTPPFLAAAKQDQLYCRASPPQWAQLQIKNNYAMEWSRWGNFTQNSGDFFRARSALSPLEIFCVRPGCDRQKQEVKDIDCLGCLVSFRYWSPTPFEPPVSSWIRSNLKKISGQMTLSKIKFRSNILVRY